MFGFFGKLFGSDKALASVVDNVAAGLDALVYTDEEQAQDRAKAVTEARTMVVGWMAATQGQNLARRLIALAVVVQWLLMINVAMVAEMAAIWADDAARAVAVGDVAFRYADLMVSPVMLVMAFYFAAPHMGDIAKAAMGRMKGTPDRVG